jgi:hypothetical protein
VYARSNAYDRTDQPIMLSGPATGSANGARASGGPVTRPRPTPSRRYQ